MMTLSEKAEEIRKELKMKGYTSRKISVRKDSSIAIWVAIKDKEIDIDEIKNITSKYESVSWHPNGYEIMSGGNHYIRVFYGTL